MSAQRCDEERSTTRRMERLIHQISGMSTARVSDGPNGLTIINVDQDGDDDGAREGEEGTEMSEELLKALSGATKANNEAAPKIEEIAN